MFNFLFKGTNRTLLLIAAHVACCFLVFYFLSYWKFFHGFGSTKSWDAYWYERISKNGYEYNANGESSCGFFPLFPYLWKMISPLGMAGVTILNFSFYIIGLLLLKRMLNFSNSFLALCLSIPSIMFMYVPYSEALFFLSTSVFMYGLFKNDPKLIYGGLLAASLTRPTALFFIPAIIFMELMHQKDKRIVIVNILKYSSVSVLGVLIVVLFQYFKTGVWFAYFRAQSSSWARQFSIPQIPFTTWGREKLLWLDGIALFFGLFALSIVLYVVIRNCFGKKSVNIDKATLFSLCYIVMATFSVVFFNSKDALGGTSLMGANRYILATPCFVFLLHFMSKEMPDSKIVPVLAFVVAVVCAPLLGLGTIIMPFEPERSDHYILFIFLYVLSYLLLRTSYSKMYLSVLYLVNIFTQIIIFSQFSQYLWVG
jgi:hypothetical protein